jgi:Tol biopolymer transport system component
MKEHDLKSVLRVCEQALARPTLDRDAFLNEVCGDDVELRRAVDALLAEQSAGSGFLEQPAWTPERLRLSPGTRLGAFEIVAPIGAGGMGDVYTARDTRLDRTVAIKILPPDFGADPGRRARFEREAKTIAGLNHPHICTLYDVGVSDGATFLVMEHLTGETLTERLQKGPLPVDQALTLATEIADALSVAHRSDVIHRDLKPANVMLTKSGAKLLDFGVAKLIAHDEPSGIARPVGASTRPVTLTGVGVIVGTLEYMAPEQLEGKATDARTDLWALGAMLYEMVTGKRAFEAASTASLMAAILERNPAPLAMLQPLIPLGLDRLVRRCLAKLPDDRPDTAHDLAHELRGLRESSGLALNGGVGASVSPAPFAGALRREKLAWALLALALVALAAVGSWSSVVWRRLYTGEMRLSIVADGRDVSAPAISPDGRRVVYRARRGDGLPMLWVRDLAQSTARALSGTEMGDKPFWSPDSRDIGFFSARALKRIPADGGPVKELAKSEAIGGSWGPDGTILFSPNDSDGIYRVSAAGGAVTAATVVPGADWGHLRPTFLPDGRRFLFTARQWSRSAQSSKQGVYLGSLENASDVRELLSDLSDAVYAPPGFLVLGRAGRLIAVPLDSRTAQVTGDPIPLGESAPLDPITVDTNGTLAIRPLRSPEDAGAQLRFVNRDGNSYRNISDPDLFYYFMSLSRDNRYIATSVSDEHEGTTEIWQIDAQSGSRIPLTAMRGWAGSPVWSPKGTQLAFACQPPRVIGGGLDDLCVKDLRTGQITTLIESTTVWEQPRAWSSDGEYLLVNWSDRKGSHSELRVWSITNGTLTPYIDTDAAVLDGVFSPDDRYVAYSSNETGRFEVSVTTFPERRRTWALSTGGARVLSWRDDGREILVATRAGEIAAYPLDTSGGSFKAGRPQILIRNVAATSFARPTRDHSHILIRVPRDAEKDTGEIRLLFDWQHGLRAGRR